MTIGSPYPRFFYYYYYFFREFQPMAYITDDVFYHQTKTLIDFWYRRRINSKFLIKPSETLPIKLTETPNLLSPLY